MLAQEPHTVLAWQPDRLEAQLGPWLPGVRVQVVPQCGSTNTVLLDRARQADEPFTPSLLVAEQQTAGRGRMGRDWWSEAGASLTFSLALALEAKEWSGLSLVVGLAVAGALDPVEPVDEPAAQAGKGGDHAMEGEQGIHAVQGTQCMPGAGPRVPAIALKWPNDLWLMPARPPSVAPPVPGRKLGGILVETVSRGAQRIAVIGIGLNIRPLAPERAAALGRAVGCLQELDPTVTAPAALERAAVPLARALQRFQHSGFTAFAASYARRDALCGQAVATTDARAAAGMAEGVGEDGALLVRSGGQLHRITSGEVSVRPLEAGAAA